MENYLVNLKVPAVGENYDVFVPNNLVIGDLCRILAEGVKEICGGRYGMSGMEMLMFIQPPKLLDPRKTLEDYNIYDGAKLMLL